MTEQSVPPAQAPCGAGNEGLPVPAATLSQALPAPQEQPTAPGDAAQPTTVGSIGVRVDLDAKADFASFAHQYIRDYISLAEPRRPRSFLRARLRYSRFSTIRTYRRAGSSQCCSGTFSTPLRL